MQEPAEEAGVAFEAAALDEVFQLTKGYPYFLQEWAYVSWNLATESPISLQVVQSAKRTVIPRLDENFFRVRYDRLAPGEKNLLRAIAELGPGAHRTGDIAEALKVKVTSLGPVRAKLINKGMIFSPAHGDIDFTVPLFDEFMIRAIPSFKRYRRKNRKPPWLSRNPTSSFEGNRGAVAGPSRQAVGRSGTGWFVTGDLR